MIAVVVLVVAVITVGAALLVGAAELRWGVVPLLHLLTAGVMLVLSGVCINSLPHVVAAVWRLTSEGYEQILALLRGLGSRLRRPLRLLMVVVTVALLGAAGWSLRPTPTGPEHGPLTIMTAFAPDPDDVRSMLIEQWNRLNPNNRATFDYVAGNTDAQHDRMVRTAREAQSAGEQRADIYLLDIVWMAEFATRGYIQPLDESKLSERDLGDFVPKVLDTGYHDGKLWALPFNSDVGMIFHRPDIPGVKVPQTWADYFGPPAKAAVTTARTSQPRIEAANAAQLAVDDEMLTITALEAIWAAGGRVASPNGQLALTADGSRVALGPTDLAGIKTLATASRDPDLVLDDAKKTSAELAAQAFSDGRTLYMRNWPVARDDVVDKVPSVVTAPPTPSVLGGQNLAISATTDKPRAAQALIQFLTSPSSQQILSEVGGFVPTRQFAFSNSRRSDMGRLQAALNEARLRPVTPCYTEFSRVFREGITRALNDNGKLEDNFAQELAIIYNRC